MPKETCNVIALPGFISPRMSGISHPIGNWTISNATTSQWKTLVVAPYCRRSVMTSLDGNLSLRLIIFLSNR